MIQIVRLMTLNAGMVSDLGARSWTGLRSGADWGRRPTSDKRLLGWLPDTAGSQGRLASANRNRLTTPARLVSCRKREPAQSGRHPIMSYVWDMGVCVARVYIIPAAPTVVLTIG